MQQQQQSNNKKPPQHHRYSSQPAVDAYLNDSNYQENEQMFMIDQYDNNQRNFNTNTGKSMQKKPNMVSNKFSNA